MTEILIILGLIILNGFFSMAEMAMVSSRKTKLETEANHGNKGAKNALKLLKKPDNFLSTIQIGITLIGILTGIYSGERLQHEFRDFLSQFNLIAPFSSPLATGIIVLIVTYFTLVLGELVPKRIGLTQPENITKSITPIMNLISRIAYPFIWLLTASTQFIVRLLKIKSNDNYVTEEEIKAMISESAEQGEIEAVEQEIIERVFHLGDRTITSLMTHRSEIKWLDCEMSMDDINDFIEFNPHTVYPVCEGNVDAIKGIVKIKNLYALKDTKNLEQIYRPALFVPENNTAYQVMEKLKANGVNICFVVDEYGTLQGMVTLYDIFEAIVGEIPDETDDSIPITVREDGSYWVDAHIHFYDFLDYFDKEDKYGDIEKFDTLAGFILDKFGHIPKAGEKLMWNEFSFEIADMDGHRIDKVLVHINNYEETE